MPTAKGMSRHPTPLPVSVQTAPGGNAVIDLGPLVEAIATRVETRVAQLLQAERQTADARPNVLTPKEAAETLRVSEATIWRLLREGALGSVKVGARRIIPWPAIEAYLATTARLKKEQ